MKSKENINDNWRAAKKESENELNFEFEEILDEEFECILPSSPNWYCVNILHCLNGYCAFGGKNAVYLFDLKKNPPTCQWSFSGASFSVRITAVSLISTFDDPEKGIDLLVYATEEGHVKVLNIEHKSTVTEHKKHSNKITSLSWVPSNKNTIISGDEKGAVLVWDYVQKVCNAWTPLQSMVTHLVTSPHSPEVTAIGYINGNIIIGDNKKLSILHTFKNHINEICFISWNPVETDQNLFVSIAKDKTMRIFNYEEKVHVKTFNMPKNVGSSKYIPQSKCFYCVLWLNGSKIISTYPSGDLLSWDIKSGKWKTSPHGHNRIVFSLSKDIITNLICSTSMDRAIILYNGESQKPILNIPTFGGFVYSISNMPHDPHRFALGIGDNTLRIWETNNLKKPYNNSCSWSGIKTKVTVVKYHPKREGIVAFGTEDGHVGCFSAISQKSEVAVSYHKRTVYALAWGPSCSLEDTIDDKGRVNCLFSIGGEGTVLMHKMGAFNQKALDFGKLIKETNNQQSAPLRSEIQWHQSYQFVAIGNDDGSIDIFHANKAAHLGRIQIHKKMINTLDWHHDFTSNLSSHSFWIACGSNEDCVSVTDVSSICLQEAPYNNNITIDQPLQMLFGHTNRITKVSWSPHSIGILASSSYDGTVQVWDVKTNEPLGNYRGHIGRVLCVAWSFVSPDVLHSGGEDFCLHRWKYTKTKDKKPPSSSTKSKSKKKKKNKESPEKDLKIETVDENEKHVIPVLDEKPPISTNYVEPKATPQEDQQGHQPELITDNVRFIAKAGETDRKRRKKHALFKKSSIADCKRKDLLQQDCIKLAMYHKAESTKAGSGCEVAEVTPGSEEHVNLGLYGNRKDAIRMLQTECEGHKENNSMENFNNLQIWQSNIPAAIEHAVENKCLTESLVAMSPLGGYDLWRSTCLLYAKQLEQYGNFELAASYYMVCGDSNRVIDMFKSNDMIKEALVFAKTHLSRRDPVINDLLYDWALKLSAMSSYEHAAECFLACDRIEQAVSILAKRNDSDAIMTALSVASTYNLEGTVADLSLKAVKASFLEQKWSSCRDLFFKNNLHLLKVDKVKTVVGELLVDFLNNNQHLTLFVESNENHQAHRYFATLPKNPPTYLNLNDQSKEPLSFFHTVLGILETEFSLSLDDAPSTEEMIPSFVQRGGNRKPYDLLYDVINYLVRSIVELMNFNTSSAFKEILLALDLLAIHGYQIILEPIYFLLFPKGQTSFNEIVAQFPTLLPQDSLGSLSTNFVAYQLQGLLYSIWWEGQSRDKARDENHNHVDISTKRLKYNVEDVISTMYQSSFILLNETFKEYFNLEERYKVANERLTEIKIKERLKQHLASNKERKNTKRNPARNQSMECEVRSVLYELIDQVVNSFPTQEDLEKQALEQELDEIKTALNKIPSEFKEYKFPKVSDSINVLLMMCSQYQRLDDEKFQSFRRSLLHWSDTNCTKEMPKYIKKRLSIETS